MITPTEASASADPKWPSCRTHERVRFTSGKWRLRGQNEKRTCKACVTRTGPRRFAGDAQAPSRLTGHYIQPVQGPRNKKVTTCACSSAAYDPVQIRNLRRLPYQKPHTMAMPFAHLDQHDLPRARPWSATRPRSGFAASASALTEQGGAVCAARPIRLNTRLPPVRSGSRRFELNHPVPNPTGVKRGCHAHCIRRQAAINCFRAV